MRFLADENFPLASVRVLQDSGYDVASMSEIRPGADDVEVLALAAEEGRVLLTFDRDYGRLLFQEGRPAPAGVVYLRFVPETPTHPAKRIARLIEQGSEFFEGSYLVAGGDTVRRRPLPRASP